MLTQFPIVLSAASLTSGDSVFEEKRVHRQIA